MKKLFRLAVAAFVVLVALAALRCWTARDAPPVQDADLRVERIEIPDEENAFHHFSLAAEQLHWPEDEAGEARVRAMLKGEEWDEAFVAELLQRNARAFEHLERGLACSQCQTPAFSGATDPLDYLEGWRSLGRALRLRATQHLREGRHAEAIETAMTAVRFGHMIEGSGGSLIHYLTGCAVKAMGLEDLRAVARSEDVPPDLLRAYANELGRRKAHVEGLQGAARSEYAAACSMMDDLVAGKTSPGQPTGGQRRRRVRGGYLFHPEKTKGIFAQAHRTFIENVPSTYAERDFSGVPQPPTGATSMVRLFLAGNPTGRMLVAMLMPALESVQERKCGENVNVGATQLLLALRAYELEKGELPATLDALVPDYLEAIPIDDFDGQPLRYLREKKAVYSVGEDLTDSGGSEGENPWRMPDPTFGLDF
jgi:hypothetical protein